MAENEKSLPSSNVTQAAGWNFYNWCKGYTTGPVFLTATSIICFFLGFPTCLWVLYELLQRQRQRSTIDVFMVSLAVIDLIFTAQVPFFVCNFMLWHINMLEIFLVFVYSLGIGRPLLMACICWDCYVAVVHPIVYKTSKKFNVIKKLIAITICLTVVVVGLVICNTIWITTTFLMAIPLIVALPVITFCDISILQALRKPHQTGTNNIHPQKKQALHTISNSLIMTLIVYLPPLIIFLLGELMSLEESERFCVSGPYGFCFTTVGCVIMPVLYLASVGKLDTLRNWWKK